MKLIENSQIPEAIKPAGTVHEIIVTHKGNFLAFSTHNCPFEEQLSIQLFDTGGEELERIDLYGAYAGGLFTLKGIGDSWVEFTFWSEDPMRLIYHDQPRWVVRASLGVHYTRRFSRRHMVVGAHLPRINIF